LPAHREVIAPAFFFVVRRRAGTAGGILLRPIVRCGSRLRRPRVNLPLHESPRQTDERGIRRDPSE